MDSTVKILLGVIAAALCAIAFRLYFPGASAPPTYGDVLSLKEIPDVNVRREKHKELLRRTPLVWVKGGEIEADVSGSVAIDN